VEKGLISKEAAVEEMAGWWGGAQQNEAMEQYCDYLTKP
jgi:hypothetical protein